MRRQRLDIVVLDATPRDHAAIAQLHAAGFPRGWEEDEIGRLAEQPSVLMLVARKVGARDAPPLGFAIIRQTFDEAEVLSIAVSPRARGTGLGGLLMRETIRRLQRDRVGELFLEVDGENEAAVRLYRRLGFAQVGERKGYYDGGQGHALVMRLALSDG